jgi:hypothetical protein
LLHLILSLFTFVRLKYGQGASYVWMLAGGADGNCGGGGIGWHVQAKAHHWGAAATFGGCGMTLGRLSCVASGSKPFLVPTY